MLKIVLVFIVFLLAARAGHSDLRRNEALVEELQKTSDVVKEKAGIHQSRIRFLTERFFTTQYHEASEGFKSERLWRRSALRHLIKSEQKEYSALNEEFSILSGSLKELQDVTEQNRSSTNKSSGGWFTPVKGRVLERFGNSKRKGHSEVRRAVTLRVQKGQPVHAPFSGTVVFASELEGLGQVAVIQSNNKLSIIYPMSVGKGILNSSAEKGAILGLTLKETLHWEMRIKDAGSFIPVDPMDAGSMNKNK